MNEPDENSYLVLRASHISAETNAKLVSLSLSDLEFGVNMLQSANAACDEELRQRTLRLVENLHDLVVRILPVLRPTAEQRDLIDARLTSLARKLSSTGRQDASHIGQTGRCPRRPRR